MGQRLKRCRGTVNQEIPEEIMDEILMNLPVKSLLRFKCVSKPWRALISSKSFTKEQLKKSKSRDFDLHQVILTRPRHSWSCSVKSLFDCDNLSRDRVPIGSWGIFTGILGSCDGLILIGVASTREYNMRNIIGRDLLLWNPSTRETKHIPSPASYIKPKQPSRFDRYLYGFGYDESTHDYKIVFTYSFSNTYQTEIYSLKNDSWKRIESIKIWSPAENSGQLVKGNLHWLGYVHRNYTHPQDLVALDLAKEEYKIVGRPQHSSSYRYWRRSVSNLGGHLCLVFVDPMTSDIHLWSMMKYGEVDSWTKIWVKSEYTSPEGKLPLRSCRPLWLRENGDFAVLYGTCIKVYNIKDKSGKSQVYVVDGNLIDIRLCVESLVSPSGNEDSADEFDHQMRREQQLKKLHFDL